MTEIIYMEKNEIGILKVERRHKYHFYIWKNPIIHSIFILSIL